MPLKACSFLPRRGPFLQIYNESQLVYILNYEY